MAKPHDERRSELILTARGLFFSRGYDNCTINDIIDEVGIAKGTFYHYFRSKEELLEAMIDVMADQIMDSVEQIAVDRSRSATERMTDYFRQSMILKAQSPEMMEVALRTIYRPENTLLRVGMIARTSERVGPVLARIIADGVASAEFDVDDPDLCGEYIIRSFSSVSEKAGRLILDSADSPTLLRELHRIWDFLEWSIARLLGLPAGTITLVDRSVADELFGAINRDAQRAGKQEKEA